ncbi:hypothetical protein FPZ12_016685 [Amycolatopsis acidicola]|uniref:SCP2 sterol-binding domain-containing protein n=1 Tax=Amycolatopsis acidicola TaxID=2596893 RepID=A0A5N0V5T5_9PSEU|nr:hypothetical protein [Amycolatopsis acidicola]KAA9160473.1 hypothetical protein FPZ12_016685 [Amycolatopsis acidicola]
MPLFASSEELYAIQGPFLENLTVHPVLGPKLATAGTSFSLLYSEPDAIFGMDCTQDPPVFSAGDDAAGREFKVRIQMRADDGHRFWLGKLKAPVALATRKLKVSGAMTELMGLLPILGPVYGNYREHLIGSGHESLV